MALHRVGFASRRRADAVVHIQRQADHDALGALALDHFQDAQRRLPPRGDLQDIKGSREFPAGIAERQAHAAGTEIDRECAQATTTGTYPRTSL